MIHISLERSASAESQWAAKEKFPWYIITAKEVPESGFRPFKSTRFVPEYALFSASGKNLGTGADVIDKAVKLAR